MPRETMILLLKHTWKAMLLSPWEKSEKSSNLMWYGKWSLGIYLTEAVAVLVPHRFNYNIEQFM